MIILFPDFITQVFESDQICFFSIDISGEISCSKDSIFDDNGFSLHTCTHFPCNRIKELNKKFGIDSKR